MDKGPYVIRPGDRTMLPLYVVKARTLEAIPQFGKGRVAIEHADPEYDPPDYGVTPDWLQRISTDANATTRMVEQWAAHTQQYLYFVQFRDDPTRDKVTALHRHTELISVLGDSPLGIDTSELWRVFDQTLTIDTIYSQFREDPDKEQAYERYATRLSQAFDSMGKSRAASARVVQRILRQIELRAAAWSSAPPITGSSVSPERTQSSRRIRVFYSYSHKDENLRAQLETHLALLRRQGFIEEWHDRKIVPGEEWGNQISESLLAADMVLLLISADFIASDYCFGIEVGRAMERHREQKARVIPIILRACDWKTAPFGRLQALPKDALPVTSWPNVDEAFANVAAGIRVAVGEITRASLGGPPQASAPDRDRAPGEGHPN